LFLDTSGLTARVGVWRESCWLGWRESEAGALKALYAGVSMVMAEAQMSWEKLAGYIYVEGPGSVLGLRLAAMAIRTWQVDDAQRMGGTARPVWAGGSLQLAAATVLADGVSPPFAVFTDARQGHWNLLNVTSADPAALAANVVQEIGENELPAGTLFQVRARKAGARAPAHAQPLAARLREHPEILLSPGLFRPVDTAVPYGRAPEYRKWTGGEK
jgi:tRNA threonylcarbamoyladenosine biosynthesis protein TsaB